MTESQRVRVRIEEPQEDTSGRTGCLTLGAILGIVAGILFVLFGVGPLLDFLFPTETIAVGSTYHDDKLTLKVNEVELLVFPSLPEQRGFLVRMAVDARSSWNLEESRFVLKLEDGREIDGYASHEGGKLGRVPQGASVVELVFVTGRENPPRPEALHISEPAVKFKLPAPTTP